MSHGQYDRQPFCTFSSQGPSVVCRLLSAIESVRGLSAKIVIGAVRISRCAEPTMISPTLKNILAAKREKIDADTPVGDASTAPLFAPLTPVDPEWDELSLRHKSSFDTSIQMNRDAFGQPVWTSRAALRDEALKKWGELMVIKPDLKLSEADKNAWLLRHMVRYTAHLDDSMEWVHLMRHEYAMVIDVERRGLAAELGVSLGAPVGRRTTSSRGKESDLVFSADTTHLPADQRKLLGADGKTQTQEIIRARRKVLKDRLRERDGN